MAASKDTDASAPNTMQIEKAELDRDVEASPRKSTADLDAVEPAPNHTAAAFPKGLDKATEFLKQADHEIVVTHGDSRRVVKLIDWRILPILL